jgi:hypothetical protein
MQQLSYTAFHTLWTKPVTASGNRFEMNDAEMLTMIVSALMWRRYNGSIKLYTDKTGYEFVRKNKLLELWDGGIDTDVLVNNCYPIEPRIFWAAGKLMALEACAAPCVMLDTDLIVMKSITNLLEQSAITALHAEALEPDAYLPAHLLKKPAGYIFPDYYNWEVLPSNTAFVYIRDEKFKRFYVEESHRFMFRNTEMPKEMVSQMVFAEQRMLSMCANHAGLSVTHLLAKPFSLSNDSVIHLWGFKEPLRKSTHLQAVFAKQLLDRVAGELSAFPFFEHYIKTHYPDFSLAGNRLVNEKSI